MKNKRQFFMRLAQTLLVIFLIFLLPVVSFASSTTNNLFLAQGEGPSFQELGGGTSNDPSSSNSNPPGPAPSDSNPSSFGSTPGPAPSGSSQPSASTNPGTFSQGVANVANNSSLGSVIGTGVTMPGNVGLGRVSIAVGVAAPPVGLALGGIAIAANFFGIDLGNIPVIGGILAAIGRIGEPDPAPPAIPSVDDQGYDPGLGVPDPGDYGYGDTPGPGPAGPGPAGPGPGDPGFGIGESEGDPGPAGIGTGDPGFGIGESEGDPGPAGPGPGDGSGGGGGGK